MTDEKSLTENIVAAYVAIARAIDSVAATVFQIAERILIVGALKYAAGRIPPKAPNHILMNNVAALLGLLLSVWVLTKFWAVQAKDFQTLASLKVSTRKRVIWAYRGLILLGTVAGAYFINDMTNEIVRGAVETIGSATGH